MCGNKVDCHLLSGKLDEMIMRSVGHYLSVHLILHCMMSYVTCVNRYNPRCNYSTQCSLLCLHCIANIAMLRAGKFDRFIFHYA